MKRVVRVFHSSSHTVQTIFSKLATAQEWSTKRPACTCRKNIVTIRQFGSLHDTEGHGALIPVSITDDQGNQLRPRDSLPVTRFVSRQAARQGLTAFAKMVKGRTPSEVALNSIPFSESGALLAKVRSVAKSIGRDFVVRVVHKGAGQLRGFCEQWVWDSNVQFLTAGGYTTDQQTVSNYMQKISSQITNLQCPANPKARITRLYLIGKAKTLWAGKGWLWRPIAASLSPVISKKKLRTCARAFSRLLRYLVSEIPMSFLRLFVTDMAAWFEWCGENGMTAIAELECKEQFNNIPPQTVIDHLHACTNWLKKRCRWRASELVWSVHHTHSRLDRAGKAASHGFRYVSHEALSGIVTQELTENNGCFGAGSIWKRTNCIPMSGAFSA